VKRDHSLAKSLTNYASIITLYLHQYRLDDKFTKTDQL